MNEGILAENSVASRVGKSASKYPSEKFLIPLEAADVAESRLMRYPACLLIPCALLVTTARAASYGAPAAPAKPAVATSAPAPAAAASSSAPAPAAAATSDKPVPVTMPLDLFNGKDLTGWSYVASGKPADIARVCSVKDGVLVCTGSPQGYLLLNDVRANYVLHFEWRWTTANPKNNSGGLLNITDGPLQQNLWPISFQAQTKTTFAGDIILMSTAACAEAPAGKTANKQKDPSEKAIGEWNTADVVVRGDAIEYTVNGVLQNKVTKCVPSFGKIGFQLEGYPYEMRNIKLSPLPAAAP
jgi:hypothetical protein